MNFEVGENACSLLHGWGKVERLLGEDRARVVFRDRPRVMFLNELLREEPTTPRWNQVMPGDTVQFEAHGDTLKIKARGHGTQATVLGWKVTELDGVWDLLSIKKRNPPVPVHVGARVIYRDKHWVLMYSAMVLGYGRQGITAKMIWVQIHENEFNWVGHKDIDREHFEVIFTGWQNL